MPREITHDSQKQLQLWKDFVRRWPAESVAQLTLEQYVLDGRKNSFCYILEYATEELGTIWGAVAYKYGIFKCTENTKINAKGVASDGTYVWKRKYGESADEVFTKVKESIVSIIDAARNSQFDKIEEIETPLFPLVKWKIAFLYQPIDSPALLPIYRVDKLRKLAKMPANTPVYELQRELMSQKPADMTLLDYYDNLLQTRTDVFGGNMVGNALATSAQPANTVSLTTAIPHAAWVRGRRLKQQGEKTMPREITFDSQEQFQLWNDFLRRWPAESVAQLTLEKYVLDGKQNSFCYTLEYATEKLGTIWGAVAYKYGIFKRTENTRINENVASDGTYVWKRKYGESADEVFTKVKESIVSIIDAARNSQFDKIEEIETPLFPLVKWKIAFLYQPIDSPALLPIYTTNRLRQLAEMPAETPVHTLQKKLMSQKPADMTLLDYYNNLLQTRTDVFGRNMVGNATAASAQPANTAF